MRQPLAISAGLHLLILLVLIVGLPFIHTPPIDTPTPISISMVNPSDIARTNHVAPPTPEPPEKDEPEISQANQAPSTAPPPPPPPEELVKPEPTPPAPPPKAPPPAPSIEPLKPIELPKQAIQPSPSLPPLQKPMKVVKPQPVTPPPPVVTPPKVTKQQDQAFDTLLTNLAKDEPKADQMSHDKPVKGHPQQSAIAQQSNTMTSDELSAIRERLRACWIVPAGGYDAADMKIIIMAQFREDMSLISATLVDTDDRYNRDNGYRAAADAALRALRNPACSPLPLPAGKYADWHIIQMSFDPKSMM